MRTLHCCYDEKFIEGAIELFGSDSRVENTYVVVSEKPLESFSYIKSTNVKNILCKDFLSFVQPYDVIILHSLFALPSFSLISSISLEKKVVWLSWGWDTYSDYYPVIPTILYGQETSNCQSLKEKLQQIRFKLAYKLKVRRHHLNALKRIDFYSGVFPYEYDLIKSSIKEFKAQPLDFYYGSLNFFIPETPSKVYSTGNKKNILIGNSAVQTNNHLDALKALESVDTSCWDKLIMPLSYGGTTSYKKAVKKAAYRIFGDKVLTLDTFMPMEEYKAIMTDCKTAIFFHNRQQASDNIFLQMINGARVFMSNDNVMYHYLKSEGLKIYSLQDDFDLIGEPMQEEDVMTNRSYLSKHYSTSKLVNRIHTINSVLLNSQTIC